MDIIIARRDEFVPVCVILSRWFAWPFKPRMVNNTWRSEDAFKVAPLTAPFYRGLSIFTELYIYLLRVSVFIFPIKAETENSQLVTPYRVTSTHPIIPRKGLSRLSLHYRKSNSNVLTSYVPSCLSSRTSLIIRRLLLSRAAGSSTRLRLPSDIFIG